jgi:NAD(P)-dependent dehydrogenase (short-subunit alcohol dehydrogenase family)
MKRTVIVTGAGRGIGRCVAHCFAYRGYNVAICEKDRALGREAADEISDKTSVRYVHCDVSNEDSVRSMRSEVLEYFGGIDILINNAGIMMRKPLERLALEEWEDVISTNLTGVFLCSRYCAPDLRSNRGAIINISSTRALMSEPDTEAYSASKGGVKALTHALALSLGPEVRVNCISPGWIDTSAWKAFSERGPSDLTEEDQAQHPSGRAGTPEDVARAVIFLSDSSNSFITGADLVLDGGMTRKMIYI